MLLIFILTWLHWTNPPADSVIDNIHHVVYRTVDLSRVQFWVNNPDCCDPNMGFRWLVNKDVRGREGLKDSIQVTLAPRVWEIWAIPVDKSGNRAGLSNQLNINLRRPTFLEWFYGQKSR